MELLDRKQFTSEVISLSTRGEAGERIERAGIPVRALGMRRGPTDILKVLKLAGWLRASQPDIVQTWMYHADLLGGFAARLAVGSKIIWNIRHSTFDPDMGMSTRLIRRASAWLSSLIPTTIVACAQSAAQYHTELGYARNKMLVIPNGVDTDRFRPDAQANRDVRQKLGIPVSAPVVGLVARFHPQKDHQTFVEAAGQMLSSFPDVRFVLCGKGIDEQNEQLVGWIRASGYADQFFLLGHRSDVPRIMASFDIATSTSSHGEAFPNVVAEAMASGVPCVVTDVGDSAFIVGDTGVVAQPGNKKALIDGWLSLISLGPKERKNLGLRARARVTKEFSLEKMVAYYSSLY